MSPKKKVSKKDRARIEAEKQEALRIQREIERQNFVQIQKQRIEKEIIENEQKEIKETAEQEIRENQLQLVCKKIVQLDVLNDEYLLNERQNKEWEQYLRCDRLPNPTDLKEMNTYLYIWENNLTFTTIEDVTQRSNIVLQIVGDLQSTIDCPLDATVKQIEDWKFIRNQFQKLLMYNFNKATYYFIRNIQKNMESIDDRVLYFHTKTDNFILCLWALRQLPEPLINPRRSNVERVTINFQEVKTSVYFPSSIDCVNMVVRILWLNYDHYSHLCATYNPPDCPPEYSLDLNEYTLNEWLFKLELKKKNREEESKERVSIEEQIMKSLENIDDATITKIISETLMDDLIQDTFQIKINNKPVDQEIVENEAKMMKGVNKRLKKHVRSNEINLRKYSIVGGIININLYYQPPQPKTLLNKRVVTAIQLPKELEPVSFNLRYVPPVPPEAGVRRLPEEIEAELKKQEFEFDKLLFINIDLPETALWFEPPLICQWNETENIWTTVDIHDVKYNEDKFSIAFRAGCFGIFGIAVNKYANIPYQTWELRPEPKGTGVIFGVTAAVIICEFLIQDDTVKLTQLQCGATLALQENIGKSFKLQNLIKTLQNGGVDIFPSFDVFCYTEGTCEKLWPMEKHLYHCMAFASNVNAFTWSRWNNLSGPRSIVMQMREYQEKRKQVPYSTLLVTPYEASIVDCSEVSQTFTSSKIHKKFYSDLYHLVEGTCTMQARKKLEKRNERTIKTVSEILIATRVLSLA